MSVTAGPTMLAVREAAWGLARYAAICQDNGLVPIVEPEILLDGEHGIDETLRVAELVWAEVFTALALNGVMYEGILLKPSMARAPPLPKPPIFHEKFTRALGCRLRCVGPEHAPFPLRYPLAHAASCTSRQLQDEVVEEQI